MAEGNAAADEPHGFGIQADTVELICVVITPGEEKQPFRYRFALVIPAKHHVRERTGLSLRDDSSSLSSLPTPPDLHGPFKIMM